MDVRWDDNVLVGERPEAIQSALVDAAESHAANAELLRTCLHEFASDPSCCCEHIEAVMTTLDLINAAIDALGAPTMHRPEYYYEGGVQTCAYDHHEFPCREAEQIIRKAKARGETPPWEYVNLHWEATG